MSNAAQLKVQELVEANPVMVFSKTTCGFCRRAKNTLAGHGVDLDGKVFEINLEEDGADIQDALQKLTGQRTVPNIFIGGKHIGGSDDLNQQRDLAKLLMNAGAIQSEL